MDVQLVPVELEHKSVLRQLLELYAYDFSEYDDADVNEHGLYGYKYLDHYWTEPDRHPFFIVVDGHLAGLVLVYSARYVVQEPGAKSIAEFFVMRKYRRKGVGRAAATQAFAMFPGQWEVLQYGGNAPSYRFWEKVIDAYTGGRYDKGPVTTEKWQGQAITFDNSQPARTHAPPP
jgi:predicted acetyltransferase